MKFTVNRFLTMFSIVFLPFFHEAVFSQDSATGVRRDVVDIRPNKLKPPGIKAMAPLNEANVVFLDRKGLVGIAKFTPGLGLIAWDWFSKVQQDALAGIVPGNNLSVLTASTAELTQAFDTNDNFKLDFFQAVVSDWPGKKDGVVITAGPVSDGSGRVFFALSPFKGGKEEQAKAKVVSWHPKVKGLRTVTTSVLPISAMAINSSGVLVTRLFMPNYKDGFHVSINRLPAFDPAKPAAEIASIPSTKPSILITAELSGNTAPEQLCFIEESGVEKILVTNPASNQIIEIVPQEIGELWQGAILLRERTETPIETLCFLGNNKILGGGPEGFTPITRNEEVFRILSVTLANDGVELLFTKPVNRFTGTSSDSYAVKSTLIRGGEDKGITIPEPMVESDGRTVVLRTGAIPAESVVRIKCMNLTSENGEKLVNPMVFYTIHQR